jgi:hypothetical protein
MLLYALVDLSALNRLGTPLSGHRHDRAWHVAHQNEIGARGSWKAPTHPQGLEPATANIFKTKSAKT